MPDEVPKQSLQDSPPLSPRRVNDHVGQLIEEVFERKMSKFRQLFDELFVQNMLYQYWTYISPLTSDSLLQAHDRKKEKENKTEKELYNSFMKVKEAISKDGGISQDTYEENKYALNVQARDITKQSRWGASATHLEQEDRTGRLPTAEQIAKYPQDGKYSWEGHENIFDTHWRRDIFEGTLFQREYNEKWHLHVFRIFHQGHRDALQVETVPINKVIEKIDDFIDHFVDDPTAPAVHFTVSKEEYLEKVAEFNKQFGERIVLEVSNDSLRATFPENPQELAQKIVKNRPWLNVRLGGITYYITSEHFGYRCINIYVPDQIENSNIKFDSVQHKDCKSIIFPYFDPEFSRLLMEIVLTWKDE